jgi:hypothetical protein
VRQVGILSVEAPVREREPTGSAIDTPQRRAILASRCASVDYNATARAAIEADLPNGIRLRIPTANARLACQLVRAVAAARTKPGVP